MAKSYTCAVCNHVYCSNEGWTEADADREYEAEFPDNLDAERVSVCAFCYPAIRARIAATRTPIRIEPRQPVSAQTAAA